MAQPTLELPDWPQEWQDKISNNSSDTAPDAADGFFGAVSVPGWSLAPEAVKAPPIAGGGLLGGLDLGQPGANINTWANDSRGMPTPGTAGGTMQAQYAPDLQKIRLPNTVPAPVTGSYPSDLMPSDRATDFIKSWERVLAAAQP